MAFHFIDQPTLLRAAIDVIIEHWTLPIKTNHKTIFSKVIFSFAIRKMAEKQNWLNHTIILLSEKSFQQNFCFLLLFRIQHLHCLQFIKVFTRQIMWQSWENFYSQSDRKLKISNSLSQLILQLGRGPQYKPPKNVENPHCWRWLIPP